MLKAEIKGIGIPDEGTPQGGILSPLQKILKSSAYLTMKISFSFDFFIALYWWASCVYLKFVLKYCHWEAIHQSSSFSTIDKCYYVVDVDIKGFFDNVNHGKLLKQMWSIGIQDKKVLNFICVIFLSTKDFEIICISYNEDFF